MAVVMEMVRRPSTRGMTAAIKDELIKSYKAMEPYVQREMNQELQRRNYTGDPPKIKLDVYVSGKQYRVKVHVDGSTDAGRIFLWVDRGTSDEGNPATTYPIEPIQATALKFVVPYTPLTMPKDGVLNYNPGAPPMFINTQHVDHPGIKPRHFSQAVKGIVMDRSNRSGFYRITENAYRRGMRAGGRR